MKPKKLTRVKDAELILCLNKGTYYVGIQWFGKSIHTTVFLNEGPAKRWAKRCNGRVIVKLQASTHGARRSLIEYLKCQNHLEERWSDHVRRSTSRQHR